MLPKRRRALRRFGHCKLNNDVLECYTLGPGPGTFSLAFTLQPQLVQMGMSSSAACECDAEQTVDHVVLQCPIHRPPHALHGLTVLDDETTEWLLNTCTEI